MQNYIDVAPDQIDGRKFVKVGPRHGGKRRTTILQVPCELQSHFQEKIPVPEGYKKDELFTMLAMFKKQYSKRNILAL